MKVEIYDTVKRPWGYETLVSVIGDGKVWNKCIATDEFPSDDKIETNALEIVSRDSFGEDLNNKEE
jgi:hypothetical protein